MTIKVYRVSGMTCGGCAKHVEKALRSVAGVTSVVVDVAKGTATIFSPRSTRICAPIPKSRSSALNPS